MFHQTQAMVVSVFHFTHQIEIAGGNNHEAAILVAARRPALPPAWAAISLSLFSLKHFTSLAGYDVTGLFHTTIRLPKSSG